MKTKDLVVNNNRSEWDVLYTEVRRLCVIRGMRIRRYLGEKISSRKTVRFDRGQILVNDAFWSQLKPAHKAQITQLSNQIRAKYDALEKMQKAS